MTCGYNSYGQIGDSTTNNRSWAISVGSLNVWKSVSCGWYHTAAIKTDGTLWIWGYNGYGQLGDNTMSHKSSPLQVGGLTDWKSTGGGNYFTIAVR
jgi:alpha-tubulin suppressor-like RCC1 family protein